jgi:hypothetical protein
MLMKKNLGRIALLFLLCLASLYAKELANYNMQVSKTDPYLKEAVKITFTTQQLDHSTNMFFFLKPKKSSDYAIYLLKKESKELSYHNAMSTFVYILFPLHAQSITLNFDFTVKTASDQAVKQAYVADHDDSIAISMNQHKIKIKALTFKVIPLKQHVDLVGDFTLHSKIDKEIINQYESVNLLYTLQGKGYSDENLTLLPNIAGVTQFFEDDSIPIRLAESGFRIKKRFIYSLSAKENFTVPAIELKVFSPNRNQYYTLTSPSYKIEVKKIPITSLVDKEESPHAQKLINWQKLQEFLIYIFIFSLGFLTAKFSPSSLFPAKKKRLFQDIQESKNPKELMILLLNRYKNRNIDNFIEDLERLEYKKEGNFKEIKKTIIKQFTQK